ncbi:MAG TPA: zinc ribbon domain-containing protein [Polyangiaceae bacterium]|jgi:hypothetical protein|nr:zinc ribbon domain-containing protein [Polyangiaceae bacterium]
MALTQFVRNVADLSDDGGYKFRFHCDRCNDGVESQYVSSSANLLKSGLEVFSMFRGFGGFGSNAVQGIDRGLRGKERDSAYEKAVHEAMVHFKKCSHCGKWACDHCWNSNVGMCEDCAPDASEAAAQVAAAQAVAQKIEKVRADQATTAPSITCPLCAQPSGGGKFCQNCGGAVTAQRACANCKAPLAVNSKFCGECGAKT